MKKISVLLLCVLLAASLAGCGSAPSYYGVWSIEGLLPDAPAGDFDEEDINTIMKASFTFSAEEASCFGDHLDSIGQTVSNPEYISVDIPQESFESMAGTTFDTLGIKSGSISQISVVKDPPYNNGIVFYVVNDDTLLANSLGTFFILKKAQ